MTGAIDHRAEALLLAIVETTGGDLRAAFAVLCARVTIEDVTGEPFEAAVERAVGTYFGCPDLALSGVGAPRGDRGAVDA